MAKYPWFRMYRDVIHDVKVLSLEPSLRWSWVEILCLADPTNGTISTRGCAGVLRISEQELVERMTAMVEVGLLDRRGKDFSIHNWNLRQFQDAAGAAKRQARYAARKKANSDVIADVC